MYQNYFIVDGTKYYTGTTFLIKNMGKEEVASFICYDIERKKYVYKIRNCECHAYESFFEKWFIRILNGIDTEVRMPVIKTKRDRDIDGMPLGWMWYIFLMIVSSIFKDVIGLWLLISIVFFCWRADKKKREGTYVEW